MNTIMPQSELVRKAAVYLTDELNRNSGKSLATLLDETGMRFNLTPLDAMSLERLFQKNGGKAD